MGTRDKRREFRPDHLGGGALDVGYLGEAAVGAADDVLRPEEPGETLKPLGDEPRVLHRGRVMGDDAGNEDLAVR